MLAVKKDVLFPIEGLDVMGAEEKRDKLFSVPSLGRSNKDTLFSVPLSTCSRDPFRVSNWEWLNGLTLFSQSLLAGSCGVEEKSDKTFLCPC